MTTGTRTINLIPTWTTDQGASGGIGVYLYRSWSGADGRRSYTKELRQVPATYVPTRVLDKKGREKVIYVYKKGYTRKIRRYSSAFDLPHAYDLDYRYREQSVHQYWSGTSAKSYHTTTSVNIPSFPTPWTNNDYIKLVSKLGERINGSDFSPEVFLAELGQSLNLISTSAVRLAQSIAYLRKGQIGKAWNVVAGHPGNRRRKAAQNVLELQYGWRPLIQDMDSGARWLAARLYNPRSIRQSARRTLKLPVSTNRGMAGLDPEWAAYTYQAQLVAYLEESSYNASLNLIDAASVAWEKLPWSYVADWALPIGSYLHARGVASRLKGTFVYTTKVTKECGGVRMSPSGSVGYTKTYKYLPGSESYWVELRMIRTVSSSLPGIKPPSFKGLSKAASWEHCINALALLTASVKGKPDSILRDAGRTLQSRGG